MIKCHLLDGEFIYKEFENFSIIADIINENRNKLQEMPLNIIIELLSKLGKRIIQNPAINHLQGVSYISIWLRRKNLEYICKVNYSNPQYLDHFVPVDNHILLSAQPRGVVCHWIAGNIPTLAFFSLAQSILSKNGSIIKIPEDNIDIIVALMKELCKIEISRDGHNYHGKSIVHAISLVSFESKDYNISKEFSLTADCKVLYGGSDAIQSIIALPQKDHCEIIIFGPKYSFGVFDKEYIESDRFDKALENIVKDIAIFNQMACSSPQVIFFERSKFSLYEIGNKMKQIFIELPEILRHQHASHFILSNIINIRAQYLLSDNHEIISSDDLSWTILMDQNIRLEDPVHGKCIFIKEIDSINSVLPLITRKIQAITLCIHNNEKRQSFAKEATYRGVDRIVPPGSTHEYDHPWDGLLPLNRLVRWVILKNQE